MSTHNMFSLRNKNVISILRMKKAPYLLLCFHEYLQHVFFQSNKKKICLDTPDTTRAVLTRIYN